MMVDVEDWSVAWNPGSEELLLIVVVDVVDTAYVDDAHYCCLGDWRAGVGGVNNRPAEAAALSLRSNSLRRTSGP